MPVLRDKKGRIVKGSSALNPNVCSNLTNRIKKGVHISFKTEFKKGQNAGSKHGRWKGGISREYKTGYASAEYKEWRKKVFERDKYICQDCGVSGNKAYLTAHHIKGFAHYPKLRFEVDNGKTLCEKCHSLTDNYKGRGAKKNCLCDLNEANSAKVPTEISG